MIKLLKVSVIIIFGLVLNTNTITAQFSYKNLVEKGKYSKAHKKALKSYSKDPTDIVSNFDLSVLFNFQQFKKFNVDTAYYYSKRAEKYFSLVSEKDKEKLLKSALNFNTIRKQSANICISAYRIANNKHTIEAYNYFINKFIDDTDLIEKAVYERNVIAYRKACTINTILSYQSFIDIYPYAEDVQNAKNKRNDLAFSEAKGSNTIASYQKFIDAYPNAKQVGEAIELRDKLAFNNALKQNTSKAFKNFLVTYPNSELHNKALYQQDKLFYFENIIADNVNSHIDFLNNNSKSKYLSSITDSLYYISKRQNDFFGLKYLVEDVNKRNITDSAWYYFFKNYTIDGYPKTYEKFYELYFYDFPFPDLFLSEYATALSAKDLKIENGFQKSLVKKYQDYIKAAPEKDLAFLIFQMILEPYIKLKNWKRVLSIYKSYVKYFNNKNKKFNNLSDILLFSDKNIKPNYISKQINTNIGGEYTPVISADNKYLYFCGKGRNDNYYGEDVFVSEYKKGNWQKPLIIDDLYTYGNDAPLSISTDGNRMLIFKNGDLFYSDKTYFGWSEIEAFPKPIKSNAWEADAMMTSDGKAMMFVSERKESNIFENDENADIYVCIKENSGWSEPINLGSSVNTRFTDRSPYLHSDMKTLYFSSAGHGGLGGLDVFKITRLNDTSWTEWSEPINMGKEINTAKNDWGYKVSTDGQIAYFSATGKSGTEDIYTIKLPNYLRPGFVATISGNLVDVDKKPVEATMRWEDLETGTTVGESKSNPKDGSFFIVLPMGKIYGYYIDKDEFYPISNSIDLRTENNAIEVEEDIEMVTFNQMVDDGLAVPINNLFFPVNKDKLLPESIPELRRVADIVKKNNLKIEISGHTDNTGTKEHNQELSEKRAKAVKDFLISLGVKSDLMTIIGYGDNKPIMSNDTEKGKAKNRRVELKFI